MADDHKDNHGGGGESHGGGGGGGHGGGHGGGGGHAEGEHEGAPEWLISFADMVMLIMGFFVILLAMNMQKNTAGGIGGVEQNPSSDDQMLDFALAVRAGFNNPVDIDSEDPRDAALIKRIRERNARGETTQPGPDGDKHNVQAIKESDFFNTTGVVFFPDSSVELSEDAQRTADQVFDQIKGSRWIVELRGHASSVETMRDEVRGMRLAYDRALAVARHLTSRGFPWAQLRVVGCTDNERAVPLARDKEGHQANQRVEFVVTQEAARPDAAVQPGRGMHPSGTGSPSEESSRDGETSAP